MGIEKAKNATDKFYWYSIAKFSQVIEKLGLRKMGWGKLTALRHFTQKQNFTRL